MKLERIEQKMSSLELFRKVDGQPASIEYVHTMMSEAKEHVGNLDDLVAAARVLVKPPTASGASARLNAFQLWVHLSGVQSCLIGIPNILSVVYIYIYIVPNRLYLDNV